MTEPAPNKKSSLSPLLIGIGAAIGCGCLGIVLLFAGGGALLAFAIVRASDLHDDVLDRVRADSVALEALGAPVDSNFWPVSSVQYQDSGDSGEAEFTLRVRGPETSGEVHVEARRDDGPWVYDRLELELRDGTRIDLRDDG